MFRKWRAARKERKVHNDRDYFCINWWGDRSGSVAGVAKERCLICRPGILSDEYLVTRPGVTR